jgi:hypothetical protein
MEGYGLKLTRWNQSQIIFLKLHSSVGSKGASMNNARSSFL